MERNVDIILDEGDIEMQQNTQVLNPLTTIFQMASW